MGFISPLKKNKNIKK